MWYQPALVSVLKQGYSRKNLVADVFAGLLVAVVALPLSMALAIASGCTPEQGLWTAIIGGFLISLFGGSRVQIGGPAGAFVGLCAVGMNQFGYAGLALATLMAGVLMLILGIARLGKAISYIPMPVVIGFTTGIALILCSTQIGPALGLADPTKPAEHLHERIFFITEHMQAWNWRAVLCCGITIVCVIGLRRLSPQIPGALIAIVAVSFGIYLLGWDAPKLSVDGVNNPDQIATIASRYGGIPHGLPFPSLPTLGLSNNWTWFQAIERLRDLSSLALAIALLGSIESLLAAVVSDGMSGYRHDSNSELIGQGIANIVTPIFQGLPATGVIARTSTNVRAGAVSPIAGIIHAITILLIMLFAAPLVGHVPLAALAGVLLVVCWHMAELRHWPYILKAGRGDAFLLPIAFFLTAFIGLTEAILVGVVLSMFFFVKRMSDLSDIETHQPDQNQTFPIPPGVQVYSVRGPFFFGAATRIRDLETATASPVMILRLAEVPFIDATAAHSLRELVSFHHRRGGRLLLSEVSNHVREDLRRHQISDKLGPDAVFVNLEQALMSLKSVTAQPIIKPE